MGKRVIHSRYLVTVFLIIQTTIGCQQQVGGASQRNVEQIDAETLVATGTSVGALVTGGYGERSGPQANAWLYQP